jgi:hypothetical protein
MMKTWPFLMGVLGLLLAVPAGAVIIGTDSFEYVDGAIAEKNGGQLWNYKNTSPTGYSNAPSDWDAVVGTPIISAGMLVTSGNAVAKREYRGNTETEGAVNDVNVARKVYYKVTVTTGPSVSAADYFGISSNDFNSEKIYFGKRGGSMTWGVEEVGVANGGTNGSVTISPDTTYTLVAVIDYLNNYIRLFVDPDLSGGEPLSGSAAATRDYFGTNWSTAVRFAAGTAVSWDDLVVCTEWEDLAPVTVTTTADEDNGLLGGGAGVSLREAVKYSAPGRLITFAAGLNGQTCTLSTGSEIVVTKSLTLDASSLSRGLTIDGGTGTNHLFTVNSGQSLNLRGLTLTGGNGTGASNNAVGGAIDNAGTLTLTQCTLSGNSSGFGGGAISNAGTLTLTQCTLSANSASNSGGAISNFGGLTLTQCTLSGNSASNSGGAIYNFDGTLALTQCTLSGNSASLGGAIDCDTDLNTLTATLTHCTLTGNIASSRGGAFYNEDGRTTLVHCTITGNTAPAGQGSGVASYGDAATETVVKNTLISGNGGSSVDFVISTSNNSFTSQGGNLIGSGNATGDFNQAGDVINDSPKLSPLGYFGGPVQTMHPLIGSPAIDAAGTADPGGTDARGFPRFVDGTTNSGAQTNVRLDIGAVEAGPLRTVGVSSDAGSSGALRGRIGLSTEPGARLAFTPGTFPATITLNGTEIEIPATANGLFIDASNLSGPVTISGNNASRVFNVVSGATVAMHSVRIVNGKAPDGANGAAGSTGDKGGKGGGGGGILNAGSLSLFSCTVQENRAGRGGAGGNGTISKGDAGDGGDGGGIASSGSLNLTACTVSGNSGGNPGIGNGNNEGGGGDGGGIFSSGSLNLTTCTLSGNGTGRGNGSITTRGHGGGIASSGSLRLTASTLAGNRCDFGKVGGGIFATNAILEDCIIGLNTRGGGPPDDVNVSTITYVGGNLLGTAATVTGAATGAPTFVETPSIRDLGDYGGPTQTVALQPNSRARNAGTVTASSTDQRGFPIVGEPDLGAFEAQIGAIADVSLLEGATPPARTFPVGQIGALTATSSNPTLVPEENIEITGSGASRSVTVTPAAGQRGSCIITLTEVLHGEQQTFQVEVTEDPRFLVINNNPNGAGSLRVAFTTAAGTPGTNTIRFAPGVTEINLAGELSLQSDDPEIIDAGTQGLILNAGPNSRHFQVPAGRSLTLRGITLQGGNAGGDGGSIYSEGTLILERCRLTDNQSAFNGGAVGSRGTELRAVDCTFFDNTARAGGGVFHAIGAMELIGCTFASNTASMAGALLLDNAMPATLTQCTLAINQSTAPTTVGGIRAFAGTLNLVQCTVSGNVGDRGGLELAGAAAVNLTNNIIAGNRTSGGAPVDLFLEIGTLVPQGVNLIGSNASVEAVFPAGPLVGTAAAPRDPMLASFDYYGGPTDTMPPRVGSPALDQATVLDPALTTDQRGFARPLGIRPDLGAVEASIIVVTTPVDELDPPGSPGNGVSLREAVRDLPENGAIDFDRAIFGGATAYVLTLTQGPLNPPQNGFLFNSANPNGLHIQYAATITQQPQSQSVDLGATAIFSVGVVNVSGGVAYQWRKNGSAEATTASLSLSNAQESNEGVYDVVLSEAPSVGSIVPASLVIFPVSLTPFAGTSQPASLAVDEAPVTIRQITARTVAPLGSSQRLSVVAVGPSTLPLTYQWSLNGKRISGATQSTYSIPKLALSQAGSYSCVVKSGLDQVSATTELAVVDTTPKVLNIKSNTSFTATVIAAGNGLAYAWKKDGAPFLNLTGKTFTLGLTDVSNAGLFTCDVRFQGGGGNTLTTGFNTRLNVSAAAPVLATPLVLPPAYIGQNYFYRLPVVDTLGAAAASFSVTGALPKGVVFNKTTGVLSGRPTVTKSAGYPLSFRAINPSGSSAAVAATLTVNVVPPTAVGVFAGPLGRSALNGNLGGRFDLTTTAAGSFSGSITLGVVRRSFRNQLLLSGGDGDVILRGDIPGIRLADNTLVTAYVEVFAVEQVARVTLVGASGTTLEGTAWRNPWRLSRTPALNNPATGYAARYHLRLDAGFGSSFSPEGYGFASFTVSSAGALTLAGRLPDGSGVTGGTFVGPEGQVLVFHLLYGNRGSQVGQLKITKAAAVVDNTLTGRTSWLKPGPLAGSKDTVYKAGFGPLNVNVNGGVYVAPAKGAIVAGFTAVAADQTNAKLKFELGGLTAAFSQLLRIANPRATGLSNTAVLAAPIANTLKITSFNASTGTFAGSFILPGASPALNRPAPFFGQLVEAGGVEWGYGYFLLPQVPVGTEKVSTAPKLSGSVLLQGP